MGSGKYTSASCIVLLLTLCSELVNGQDDCVTLQQEGSSVLNGLTKLMCSVKDQSDEFLIMLDSHAKPFTLFERRYGQTLALRPCPPRYDCQWDEAHRAVVVMINKTSMDEVGQWTCNYQGRSGCIGYSYMDVNVLVKKASTRVTSITKGVPTEGQRHTLRCDITSGTPKTEITYEWKRDGVTLVETGATLTISEVERSMHGSNYTCAADNGAGMGEHGEEHTFNVLSKPSVIVWGPPYIQEHSTVKLGCYMTDGYPHEITGVRWIKDGSTVSRPNMEGGTVDHPSITLYNFTLEDAGDYVCVLSNSVGEEHSEAFPVHVDVMALRDQTRNTNNLVFRVGLLSACVAAAVFCVGLFFLVMWRRGLLRLECSRASQKDDDMKTSQNLINSLKDTEAANPIEDV